MNDDARIDGLIDLAYFGAAEAGMTWIDCRKCGEVGRSVWKGQVEACPECGDNAYLVKHPSVQIWQKYDRNITTRYHALCDKTEERAMIRNAKIGERVQVLDTDGKTPLTYGSQSYIDRDGTVSGHWDYAKGNTGTIVEINYVRGRIWEYRITVEPDPPNFGAFVWFTPKQMRRLK